MPTILFEDAHVLAIDKPAGLLSQPGLRVHDSVHSRALAALPGLGGPVIVHRLDMDTSGVMLLARHRDAHRHLQQQFEKRQVGKLYVAQVRARIAAIGGRIVLPLRLDLDDRPRQIVCHAFGKAADTAWRRLALDALGTRLLLLPRTGRTHQLRVHLAHAEGLAAPIGGDRLYGDGEGRLLLHACRVEFTHPVSGRRQAVCSHVPF